MKDEECMFCDCVSGSDILCLPCLVMTTFSLLFYTL